MKLDLTSKRTFKISGTAVFVGLSVIFLSNYDPNLELKIFVFEGLNVVSLFILFMIIGFGVFFYCYLHWKKN